MEDRLAVGKHYIEQGYTIGFVLAVCEVASSTWYDRQRRAKSPASTPQGKRGRPYPGYSYDIQGNPVLDCSIVLLLKQYRSRPECMNAVGYHCLRHYLRRDHGIIVNPKKLYRLCKAHDLLLPRHRKKRQKHHKISRNRVITQPNRLWQFDIKYGYIHGENRHFYLAAFKDIFDKEIVGYHIGLHCQGHHLALAFQEAVRKRQLNDTSGLVIRSDNGPQMTSYQFQQSLAEQCEHEFIPPGCPNKNAYIESFFSIIETEFLQVRYFNTFQEAYVQLVDFIDYYNQRRLHGSLFYLPPREFQQRYWQGEFGTIVRKA